MATNKILIGNIKGPKGDTGDTGATGLRGDTGATGSRGSHWYSGSKITGTSTTATIFSNSGITDALVNDQYLNTSTGNTYRCTVAGNSSTAKWVYTGNIKGAKGEKGDTGATGPIGPQGEYATIDDVLSDTSVNPVQNKIIKAELDKTGYSGDYYSNYKYETGACIIESGSVSKVYPNKLFGYVYNVLGEIIKGINSEASVADILDKFTIANSAIKYDGWCSAKLLSKRTVQLNLLISNLNLTAAGSKQILSITSEYRPKNNIRLDAVFLGASGEYAGLGNIDILTSGEVKVNCVKYETKVNWCCINTSYNIS